MHAAKVITLQIESSVLDLVPHSLGRYVHYSRTIKETKCQKDLSANSDNKRLKGKITQPIAHTLQPIFNKFGCKLKLITLLQYYNASMNELLRPETSRPCAKALLIGCCSTAYTKHNDWNPSLSLVRRIIQKNIQDHNGISKQDHKVTEGKGPNGTS